MRKERAFKVKQKAFSIIFKGLSVIKNCLRPQSSPVSTNLYACKNLLAEVKNCIDSYSIELFQLDNKTNLSNCENSFETKHEKTKSLGETILAQLFDDAETNETVFNQERARRSFKIKQEPKTLKLCGVMS